MLFSYRVKLWVQIIFVTLVLGVLFWIVTPVLKPELAFQFGTYRIAASNSPLELAWEFQAPDNIQTPATIGTDGTIYVASGGIIYALNPKDGHSKWQHQNNQRMSFILPIADLVLVTTSENSVIQALSVESGKVVWELPLGKFVQTTQSFVRDPSVTHLLADNHRVYVGADLERGTQVLALEPTSGQLLWKAPAELPDRLSYPYAIFANQEEVIVVTDGDIIFLDKTTGEIVRSDPFPFESYRPPSFYVDTLYTSGEIAQAIDINTLQEKWQIGHECSGLDPRIPYPPQILGDIGYTITTCSLFRAVDTTTGQILWDYEDSERELVRSFNVFQDIGYLLTQDAILHALDLTTGQEIGRMEFRPSSVLPTTSDHLTTSPDLLLLSYGNHQLFAFRSVSSSEIQQLSE